MGVKITDMTAAGSVAGTELIPTSKAGAPRTVTPAQIKTYVVDEIEAISAGLTVAAGNGLFALQSGVMKPVDIDLVTQRALDLLFDKATASIADANLTTFEAAGVQKTITAANLAEYVRTKIEAAILDVSDLSSATVGTSDYMLVTQGTTAKKITVQNLYDAIYAGLGAHVAGKSEIATPTTTDVLYIVRGTTGYKITLEDLADYVASGATLSGSGTTGFLAKWSGSGSLTDGPAIAVAAVPFGAGADSAIPTTAAVRDALNDLVYDQTEIGAGLADADTVLVNDGDTDATQKKALMSRFWTYVLAKITALTSLAGFGFFVDEDDMASDSATKVPSQQSVKAYVDAEVLAGTGLNITGLTDIGAAIVDADEFPVYDNSATANRKSTINRIYAYILTKFVSTDVPITSGTDIGAAIVDADEVLLYDASATANRKSAWSRVYTYVITKLAAVTDVSSYAWVVDEDNMISNSATKVPTQQSTKAYIDAAVISAGAYDGDITDLDIDGGADIGEALADADLLIVDNGASGTNRKSTLARVYAYIQSKLVLTDVPINAGTDIGAALEGTDLLAAYDGSAAANRKTAVSRIKTYVETAGTYKTLWIPASAMVPSVTAPATADTIEYTSNHQSHDVMVFQGLTADQNAEFSVVMPEAWDRGTVKAKLFWAPGDAAANANEYVGFYLAGGFLRNDDAMDAALGTEQLMADQAIADDDMHVSAASPAITLGGTGAAEAMTHWKLRRDFDYSGVGTPMDVDARVFGVLIQYQETNTVAAW